MADIRATQSGDFSLGSTWVGGVVPGSGDVAFANTFTVTISDARTVQAVSNAAGTGIAVGGTFSLLNNCNLTCTNANGVVQGATATSCITTPSLGVGSAAILTAAITGGAAGSTVSMTAGGTLTALGNYAAGVQQLMVISAGTVNHTGTLTGGTERCIILLTASANLIQTGDVTGGTSPSGGGLGISASGATAAVTGTVTGGTGAPGISLPTTGTANLTVNGVCRSSATQPPISAGSNTQNVFLSGPFQMGLSGNINPLQVQRWMWAPTLIPSSLEVARSDGSTRRLFYTADNMPAGGYPVAANVRQSTVYGPSNEFTGTLAVPSPSSVALAVPTDNTIGTAILTAASIQAALTAQGLTTTRAGYLDNIAAALPTVVDIWTFATRTLTSGGGGGGGSAPTAVEVATAVWAAAARTLTTTIPTAADVATAVWAALTRTLTASSDPSAATIATAVRTELATELGRVDASISTRLAAASYTAPTTPPTATAIRAEMDANSTKLANLDATISSRLATASYSAAPTTAAIRTELSVELARLDVAVSTRLAPSGTLATVTTLTNAPTGIPSAATIATSVWGNTTRTLTASLDPSAATIAGQVRTELSVELARLDVSISTRLATASYSAAPTTAAIRTELSVELARLDVAVSTRLAPAGTLTRVTLVDTTTNLTNGGGGGAPSAAQVATAVRTELTPELDRIANCSTVDTTATAIQDAVSS
jgi:hypothetical protein